MEILEDISLTSLSETYLERKRFYSVGSEDSATETEAGVAAKSKSRLAAKRGKAHTLTSARVDLRDYCGGPHLKAKCAVWLARSPPFCQNCHRAKFDNVEYNAFSDDYPVRRRWDDLARSSVAYC
ncbi:unnamed protein product [Euphydryas editha]|uniref:Uncharacterized protein n=1 Tax=Euphydryas editha TaxID=104508 RepID=A0AAU9V9Z3_EUPED|nr:unnamed protein product [Euphydryas editha]